MHRCERKQTIFRAKPSKATRRNANAYLFFGLSPLKEQRLTQKNTFFGLSPLKEQGGVFWFFSRRNSEGASWQNIDENRRAEGMLNLTGLKMKASTGGEEKTPETKAYP